MFEKIKKYLADRKMKQHPLWNEYQKRVLDKKPICDHEKGCGYYLPETQIPLLGSAIKRHSHDEWKMESGRIGIWKLLDYVTFSDPYDMVKDSAWQFLGYKGMKPIENMTFEEFCAFHTKYFT
jgi:hypothetical protein